MTLDASMVGAGPIATVTTIVTATTTLDADPSGVYRSGDSRMTPSAVAAAAGKGDTGSQGLSAAAVVGISIAFHIVFTIILVLIVRAYRQKYKKLKKSQGQLQPPPPQQQFRGGGGIIPPVGGGGRGYPTGGGVTRSNSRVWFSKLGISGGGSSSRLSPDMTSHWIKLQDKMASSDMWSQRNKDPSTTAVDRSLLPPPMSPAILSSSSSSHPTNQRTAAVGLGISHMHMPPSYYRHSGSNQSRDTQQTYYYGSGSMAEEIWNDARWNEVLLRTLREPPQSQAASMSQVSLSSSFYEDEVASPNYRQEGGGGGGGGGVNNVVHDHDRDRDSSASANRSLRQMHSRRRLINNNISGREEGDEVIQIGHMPELEEEEEVIRGGGGSGSISSNNNNSNARVLEGDMLVREAVPPPLRQARELRTAETVRSHWSWSS